MVSLIGGTVVGEIVRHGVLLRFTVQADDIHTIPVARSKGTRRHAIAHEYGVLQIGIGSHIEAADGLFALSHVDVLTLRIDHGVVVGLRIAMTQTTVVLVVIVGERGVVLAGDTETGPVGIFGEIVIVEDEAFGLERHAVI